MNFLSLMKRALISGSSRRRGTPYRPVLESLEDRVVPAATITINPTASVHAIDPNIYGAAFATTTQMSDLGLTVNRDGGNASDTYNWQVDASNHASDWYYESISSGSGNGQSMDTFVSDSKSGGAQADLTVPIMPWVAKTGSGNSNLGSYPVSVYGPQQNTDPFNSAFGNGVTTGGANITDTNPGFNYVANSPSFEQTWIQHLISTFGNSSNGGVQYYTMGNEPGLWNSTHRDIHPNGETNTELLNDIINTASMIKSLDPGAKILGTEEWGWTNYFIDGADSAASNWGATYNGLNAQQWLLQQMQQYQTAHGTRMLDYFTLHYYPQGGEFGNDVSQSMELLRNQSTRSLWDPNYVDQSWIASTGINGGKVDLIPMMQSWVNTYYPGTKVGVTEYNWGAEGDMNGATTQADIWGIFGRQALDLGTRWTTPATGSPTYLAMKMYRNYDGNHSGFGDTSVSAAVGNPDQTDAFASLRSSDGALTVMVVNKNLYSASTPTTTITVNLGSFASNLIAHGWQLAAINPSDQTKAAITPLTDIHFSGNSFTATVPDESVTMFVLMPASSGPGTPTGVQATAGVAQVLLSWNTVTGATSYNIFRATTPGGEGSTVYKNVTGTSFTNTGLTNGTTYYYTVSAVNTSGQSSQSSEVSATPQVAPPGAPTGLAVTPGNAQVILTWNGVTGATSYDLYRGTSAGGEGATPVKTGISGTSFTDTGLTNGTTYFYEVTAVNAGGQGNKSSEVSATPQVPAPAAPTGLTATPGNAQVSLSWSAASGATTYDVYRGTSAGGEGGTPIKTGISGTTFTDTGLNNGTMYFYEVSAVNVGGQGPKSSEAAATPQVPAPPPPTGLNATPGNTQVALTWNGASGATSYNIYRGTASGGESLIKSGVGATSFTDTSLTNGTTYFYKVAAVNAGGTSGMSSEVSATPQVSPPSPPTGLVATPGNAQVGLSWNTVTGATSYNIYRATSAGGEGITPFKTGISGTSFTDSGLSNSTTYFYEVAAVNPGGEGGKSGEVSATPQIPAPPAPIGLTATPGNAQVSLSWSAASGATSYDVYRGTSAGGESATPVATGISGTSFTDAGLSNGTPYFYKVTAVNAGGQSPKSGEASATPQVSAPPSPTGLSATAGSTQVSLTWSAATGAATYNIYRGTTSGGESLLMSGMRGTAFTDTGLTNGTTYFYQVSAVNAGGQSGKSGEVSASPQAPPVIPPPPAPTNAGFDELGAYRPGDGSWSLDSNGTFGFQTGGPEGKAPLSDRVVPSFSAAGQNIIPVSGDWAGIGTSEIGDFTNGTWHLDLNNNGALDAGETFSFGVAGDLPVPGKYIVGAGTELAVFRSMPQGYGEFFISDPNWRAEAGAGQTIGINTSFIFGAAGDRVVVGDWNGAGLTEVGVFRSAAAFGAPNAAVFSLDVANQHTFDATSEVFIFGTVADGVVIGDWNGSGTSKVGVYRPATAFSAPNTAVFSLDTAGHFAFDASSAVFMFGLPTDKYVTGRWSYTTAQVPGGAAADILAAESGRYDASQP